MASLLEINGTHLFVDERGSADGRAVLFIHGGPGNSCWDFMASVGDAFAARGLRVIGVDQRGVLRSDPLREAPLLKILGALRAAQSRLCGAWRTATDPHATDQRANHLHLAGQQATDGRSQR